MKYMKYYDFWLFSIMFLKFCNDLMYWRTTLFYKLMFYWLKVRLGFEGECHFIYFLTNDRKKYTYENVCFFNFQETDKHHFCFFSL